MPVDGGFLSYLLFLLRVSVAPLPDLGVSGEILIGHVRRSGSVPRPLSDAGPLEMSLPAVSTHLKVLERAGLIARGRKAQWRPCRLEAGPLKDAADWLEDYRRFWDESLARLDDYLGELQRQENNDGRKS